VKQLTPAGAKLVFKEKWAKSKVKERTGPLNRTRSWCEKKGLAIEKYIHSFFGKFRK